MRTTIIRKISFTGSTAVGKMLAELAGRHMKRATMELGGHAPAIVFDDADVDKAARQLAAAKYRNAGQVCIAPTRFLVQEAVYDSFLGRFVSLAKDIKVGDGRDPQVTMGPLAHARRIQAMEELVGDAVKKGAQVATGGGRLGNKGYFFQPTVLTDVPTDARIMNEEPFGPVALVRPFRTFDDAMEEANRLPYASRSLRLHTQRAHRQKARQRDRERDGLHQSSGPCPAGDAFRGDQGFRLRVGGWAGSARVLSEHEIHHARERLRGLDPLPEGEGGRGAAG